MKVLLAFLLSTVSALAVDVHLAWDASASPGITNYVLQAKSGNSEVTLHLGTNLTVTAEGCAPGTWEFRVACMADGISSEWSAPLTVEVPVPPTRLRTVVVQYSGTLTNFYDVGFFRLRLP